MLGKVGGRTQDTVFLVSMEFHSCDEIGPSRSSNVLLLSSLFSVSLNRQHTHTNTFLNALLLWMCGLCRDPWVLSSVQCTSNSLKLLKGCPLKRVSSRTWLRRHASWPQWADRTEGRKIKSDGQWSQKTISCSFWRQRKSQILIREVWGGNFFDPWVFVVFNFENFPRTSLFAFPWNVIR